MSWKCYRFDVINHEAISYAVFGFCSLHGRYPEIIRINQERNTVSVFDDLPDGVPQNFSKEPLP